MFLFFLHISYAAELMIDGRNNRFVYLQANTAVFEACSKERIQPFDDEEEEDIWEDKEISFATQTKSRKRSELHH